MVDYIEAFPSWREIAASAYRAYAAVTDNKNFRGDPMPGFYDLPAKIQEAWIAAAQQSVEAAKAGRGTNLAANQGDEDV